LVSTWQSKRLSNKLRDKRNLAELRKTGWKILIIWECWLEAPAKIQKILQSFLIPPL